MQSSMLFYIEEAKKKGFVYPNDMDHGEQHHVAVLGHLAALIQYLEDRKISLKEEHILNAIEILAIHDTIDHKYSQSTDPDQLRWFSNNVKLVSEYFDEESVKILNSMSWSKREKIGDVLKTVTPSEVWTVDKFIIIWTLVTFADWADAIRIDRCLSYTTRQAEKEKWMAPNIKKAYIEANVIKHCNEKLLHIKDVLDSNLMNLFDVKSPPFVEELHQKLLDDMDKLRA